MGAYMKSWIEGQSPSDKQFILNGLSKDSVRNHKNKRKGHESDQEGHGAHGREWFSVVDLLSKAAKLSFCNPQTTIRS
jgi:hypothetical protein